MEPIWIVVVAGVAVLLILALVYNSLIGKKNRVENAFASIDVMLKKRFDLIPALVATVKQYAGHERETLTSLTELRARAAGTPAGADAAVGLDDELSRTLSRVMVIAESYPALAASESFQQLQRSLNEVEEQLSASRRAYNAAVTEYNDAVEMFPTNVMAGVMGYRRRACFTIPETERARPDVAALFRA